MILKKLKTTNEQIEYALYVNLPKMLRNTNITPYSILDCTKYASVYQFLFDQLTQLFGMNIPELIVTGKSYSIADVEGNVQDKDINIVLNVKNERNSQPVIEEKNRAIGKTYMSNFLLRKALSMANTAVSSDEVASNE